MCSYNYVIRNVHNTYKVYFIDLPPSYTIEIWPGNVKFDTVHETRWGGTCPGDNIVACTDNPVHHTWFNNQDSTQRVYFVVDGYSSAAHGQFDVTWTISTLAPTPAPSTSPSSAPTMHSLDPCTAGKYRPTAQSSCTTCGAGRYSLAGADSESDCLDCPLGYFSDHDSNSIKANQVRNSVQLAKPQTSFCASSNVCKNLINQD